jgi:uncharacterized protein YyaL (SSP411 family)
MSGTPSSEGRRANHLAGQTSPYLLQHLHNPVDWYSWGPEAHEKARTENKPIFLSIGYAACHWCHVMERESFENIEIAAFLNEHFVSIKVDREERPDIDEIYMTAVQLMTGSGGWPLSVFLTPGLEPFFGGTYFPPVDAQGRAGFPTVLARIHEAWVGRREEVEKAGRGLTESIRTVGEGRIASPGGEPVARAEIARAVAELTGRFDARWGGFGVAPKFPPHGALTLLLREHARTGDEIPIRMAEMTLDRMVLGGMYDHVGGGFARYSVDERWLVPHFEKMLYDQALLVPVYVDAWQVTRRDLYRRVVEETLDFARREMTAPEGALFSSLDADSEGVEGKFYVWSPDEVREVLGSDADLFCGTYGITDGGNFEGKSIPNLLDGDLAARAAADGGTERDLVEKLAPLRAKMLAAREGRVRPGTDDKILTAWNGLMITAFARAFQAFGRPEDLTSAERAAGFILDRLVVNGRLRVSFREGKAQYNAYLDDYAFFGRGLLDLYESTGDRAWLDAATGVTRTLVEHFGDPDGGGFFFTSDDHESLLARIRSTHDGALPAGAGVAAELLLRLALHLDDASFRGPAVATLEAYRPSVEQAASAFPSLLVAAEFAMESPVEIAIVGERAGGDANALLRVVGERFLPNRVIQIGSPDGAHDDLPLLRDKKPVDGRAAAYVCRDYACKAPVTDAAGLVAALES